MTVPKIKSRSQPTLNRLPLYLRFLKKEADKLGDTVSCTLIAGEFGFDPTQVRKDLASAGAAGTARIGYKVKQLISSIEEFLGWNNCNDAFLVGVGHMGQALMGYQGLKQYGISIVAAFDTDKSKIGRKIQKVKVLTMDKMPELAERMHVHLGIITVPEQYAQEVAEMMIEAGIMAIWNFAPLPLKVPEEIIVENARFTPSLAALTTKLKMQMDLKYEVV